MSIYGMDLGTTNSMIGLGDELISEMVPSIAKIETEEAGEKLRHDFDTSRSFKVDISLGNEGKESVVASSLVLKEMKRIAEEKGYNVKDVVISVPAYFSDNQRQATRRAAEMAGMNVVSLINEPTAAAMFYSKNMKDLTLVFDLGGGTFDVSVIDSRFGNYDVQSTDGVKVGGDNLDSAIMKYILKEAKFALHHLTKSELGEIKYLCEQAKIAIQKTRSDYVFDFTKFEDKVKDFYPTLSVSMYKELMKTVFAGTISTTKQVIAQSIQYGDKFQILLVGGSTRCPFLQEWLADEVGVKPAKLTYNPDKIVGQGACLYAKMVETGEAEILVSDVTKALSIGMHDGTVRNIIMKNSKVPITDTLMVTNPVESSGLELKLYQGDSALAVNNEYIGTLRYDFGEVKEVNTANVKITVSVASDGVISFKAKEPLKKEVSVDLRRNDI